MFYSSSRKILIFFLAACNYLREYIPFYSDIAAPLYALTSTKGHFRYSEDALRAFSRLREALVAAVELTTLDQNLPLHLYTDASDVAAGAVLVQPADGIVTPICFASKLFSRTQRAWSVTDREAFAVAWALESSERFFLGSSITVFTDHRALTNLATAENPKLIRLALKIARYRPKVVYLEGEDNFLADWMSRSLEAEDTLTHEVALPIVASVATAKSVLQEPPLPDWSSFARRRKRNCRRTPNSVNSSPGPTDSPSDATQANHTSLRNSADVCYITPTELVTRGTRECKRPFGESKGLFGGQIWRATWTNGFTRAHSAQRSETIPCSAEEREFFRPRLPSMSYLSISLVRLHGSVRNNTFSS